MYNYKDKIFCVRTCIACRARQVQRHGRPGVNSYFVKNSVGVIPVTFRNRRLK